MLTSTPQTLLEKILQQFNDEHKNTAENVIQKIPPDEMWRYFIDYPANQGIYSGDMQDIGWLPFTEKNYLTGLTKAFHSMLTTQQLLELDSPTFSEELVEILLKLQKNAVFNVLQTTTIGFCQSPIIEYQLRDQKNSTRAGFEELLNKVKKDSCHVLVMEIYDKEDPELLLATNYLTNFKRIEECKAVMNPTNNDGGTFEDVDKLSEEKIDDYYHLFIKCNQNRKTVCSLLTISMEQKPENIVAEKRARVKQIIETYQNDLKNAKNNMQDRLTAIAKLTIDLVQYHPFTDGNARSIAILFLNFLLKENGFPPAVINPNFSGGYSYKEWENEILSGMERALELAKTKSLPCIATDTILTNATAEKKLEHQEAVEIEKLGRKIRNLYAIIPKNELIKPIIDHLEKFIYEENITNKDILSINHICTQIMQLNTVETKDLKDIFSAEIQKLSSRYSSQLFTEVDNVKLQNSYKTILESMNASELENLVRIKIGFRSDDTT